jgi:hypothetical protein
MGGKQMAATPPTRLDSEMALYEAHKLEWLQNHRDEFVVIKANSIVGFFSDFHDAYGAGVQKFGIKSDFLVKRIVPQEPIFVVF